MFVGLGEQRKTEEQNIRCFARLKNGPPCSRLVFVLLIAVVLEMRVGDDTVVCVADGEYFFRTVRFTPYHDHVHQF